MTTIQSSHLQEPKPFAQYLCQCLCHLQPANWSCPRITTTPSVAPNTDHTEAPIGTGALWLPIELGPWEDQQEIRGRGGSSVLSPCLPSLACLRSRCNLSQRPQPPWAPSCLAALPCPSFRIRHSEDSCCCQPGPHTLLVCFSNSARYPHQRCPLKCPVEPLSPCRDPDLAPVPPTSPLHHPAL